LIDRFESQGIQRYLTHDLSPDSVSRQLAVVDYFPVGPAGRDCVGRLRGINTGSSLITT
jgi:hypothetical protein